MRNLTPSQRRWLYTIAGAVITLLVGYSIITDTLAPAWMALVGAVLWALGNITAIIHTDSTGRAALYGIAVAVLGLLVGYQVIDEEQAALWTALAAAVFGVGSQALAAYHVHPGINGTDGDKDAVRV